MEIKELYELFPKGPAKLAAKIGGIPNPRAASEQHHLSTDREGLHHRVQGLARGHLPALIMANGARMEGIEVNLFFTFFGMDVIVKKRGK